MVAVLTGWHCVLAWGRLTAVAFPAPPPFCRPAAFASVALALAATTKPAAWPWSGLANCNRDIARTVGPGDSVEFVGKLFVHPGPAITVALAVPSEHT